MGFSCGIIGLPNVGKSTIFNSLTSAKAASENFPFCTIEPNTGVVPVPDLRLNKLAELASSKKIIPTQMTFVDIAGLIKGASQGEGLGNQFLGHIRQVDAVVHVVRCFDDENVIHVDGSIDAVRDIETIETELILSDLESVQKQITKLEKLARSNDKEAKEQLELLKEVDKSLSDGISVRKLIKENSDIDYQEVTKNLLTAKPILYVGNIPEDEISIDLSETGNSHVLKLKEYCDKDGSELILISGQVESEISEFSNEERDEYLKELGVELSGLDRLTISGYSLLDLITFFTVGPKEAHAWTAQKGSSAPQAAGKIHTDFEKGFIRAEVIAYDDYIENGSELKCKEAGKLRVEGKTYIVEDGDIVHFRFNV
ncbi:UNVERIFIED_CONTAM: hypothetical protein GTU68_065690 [Idotea baltica]|nr:hypothetical protein [Idotea baltica]